MQFSINSLFLTENNTIAKHLLSLCLKFHYPIGLNLSLRWHTNAKNVLYANRAKELNRYEALYYHIFQSAVTGSFLEVGRCLPLVNSSTLAPTNFLSSLIFNPWFLSIASITQ